MGRFVKLLSIAVAALLGLLLVAAVAFSLLFDPNDYREQIATRVQALTGRTLHIEGDLDLKLFPWLAIEMGHTELGNAAGFGEQPFASFDAARLNVRLLPLLLRREVLIGTAELDALELNLAVNKSGLSNWQDLMDRAEMAGDAPAAESDTGAAALDIGGVRFADARLVYDDAELGEHYELGNLQVASGAVRAGEPVNMNGSFSFTARPAELSGEIEFAGVVSFQQGAATVGLSDLVIDGTINGLVDGVDAVPIELSAPLISVDTDAQLADVGELGIDIFDLEVAADVEPFSYAADLEPVATLTVAEFAPRKLLQELKIEVPETADATALGKLVLDGRASMKNDRIALTGLTLVLDDTTFTGELSAPLGDTGSYQVHLVGDRIDLDRYMAPTDDQGAATTADSEPPLEIPVDMIRTLEAEGALTIQQLLLAGMQLDDVVLGVTNRNSKLRLNPVTATFFAGSYQGDIRIDATGEVATLSVNEKIQDVSLAALAKTVFEQDNITGSLNGSFVLTGRGNNMDDIQRSLNGNLSFTLKDGAYEGTDLWYELRRARSLLRQTPPPERQLPARTPFSEVSATGKVTGGVMQNDDLLAELPFMRLQGKGSVDLVSSKIDYALSARVFEKPELVRDATPEELNDLSKAVIPLRISGTLAEPKIGVDLQGAAKERVVDELKGRLLKELGGDEAPPAEGEEQQPKDVEDVLKDKLKDLLRR